MEPRGALVVDLDGAGAGLRLVAVHLGDFAQCHRAGAIGHNAETGWKTWTRCQLLMLGDYNEWSQRRGLEPLGDFAVHAPGRTFHAARPIAALDRIATWARVLRFWMRAWWKTG